jgi:hypothetical protein
MAMGTPASKVVVGFGGMRLDRPTEDLPVIAGSRLLGKVAFFMDHEQFGVDKPTNTLLLWDSATQKLEKLAIGNLVSSRGSVRKVNRSSSY